MSSKKRGTEKLPPSRFDPIQREAWWEDRNLDPNEDPSPSTHFYWEDSKSILTRNKSPDIPFEASINPYRGCEHGCIYCFARPNHSYVDLSPGLDFETKIFVKKNPAELLIEELRKKKESVSPITIGTATDPYQPGERIYKNTRSILEVLLEFKQPAAIITKSSLIQRDLDLLSKLGKLGLIKVLFSITTLDKELWSKLEPRAPAPGKRMETIKSLTDVGVPTGVLFAPVIPFINDSEMESVLETAANLGAESAGMVFLRLPLEVAPLFEDWLSRHYPLKKEKVLRVISEARGGKLYDAKWGERMKGKGDYAELLQKRFSLSVQRFGLNRRSQLRTDLFSVPYQYVKKKKDQEDFLPGLFSEP
ncbi:PA0069 family radical SAM protein [Leptospira semungkisensis]|uniref:PA0069 family radical SAM protein n=1 Tax=Leptospira semungkisensis TaxID=2484985 RepID=A0A4R9G7Z2_9LEPT|nr:PA0069 family radical SAM protein [Leptospira semungkisensis]TGK07601.1 PA0069 family radical SAM protein [Leptospira semungkisensis]